MFPMEISIDIVAISQVPEGVSSIGYSTVYRGSVNRPQAGIQLVGKGSIEEEVEDNIPRQEEERSIS